MNTELKKGDRCQSPWGVVYVENTYAGRGIVDIKTTKGDRMRYISVNILTRIPTHAERMQKITDIAFDAENRLDNNETVQFRVGDMAEFVRHYLALRGEIENEIISMKNMAGMYIGCAELTEKLLKGES